MALSCGQYAQVCFFGDRNVKNIWSTPKICHQHHVNNIDLDFLVPVCWGWYNSKRFLWWNGWCWCSHFCMLYMCKKQFQTVTFSHYHFRWCLARHLQHACQIDNSFDDRYVLSETVLCFVFRFRLFYRKIKLFKTALRKIVKCAQASFFNQSVLSPTTLFVTNILVTNILWWLDQNLTRKRTNIHQTLILMTK